MHRSYWTYWTYRHAIYQLGSVQTDYQLDSERDKQFLLLQTTSQSDWRAAVMRLK